jgi:hypothetical protein
MQAGNDDGNEEERRQKKDAAKEFRDIKLWGDLGAKLSRADS